MGHQVVSVLLGRRGEREVLDGLLTDVRSGRSGVMVVRGEPGVGKSALLEYVGERAVGCRVARAWGVQSEMELPFAGLHQLCAPMLDLLERLPAPQRDALGTAFGVRAGEAADRFVVGLAVLSLLSEVAERGPLVCLIDDAQWLDRASAQTLAFVGRRLLAESVAVIFAVREPTGELSGLPELLVEGLEDADARALLDAVIAGPLDERVRDRVVAETRGNPLALLELPRGLSPAQLAGGFALPDAMPLSGRIEDSFRRRLRPLPPDTRSLLLIAAAEPLGEPILLWRAAEHLGIGADAGRPAVSAGLVEFGARVRFRHPLVRSAIYRAASADERQAVHRALADATDPEVDPDRRAWHRAHAASGPDETIAQELQRTADRAKARGGLAAAAALLQQATALTPDPAHKGERALIAAYAKHLAGARETAVELLATAETTPLDELQRARADLLRAKLAYFVGGDAPSLMLKAAKQLEPLDATLARQTYLDAFSGALFVGRLGGADYMRQVAEAVRAAPSPSQPERAPDLLLAGLALWYTEGCAAGAPMLKRALGAFVTGHEEVRSLWLASHVATQLWDDHSWYEIASRQVRHTREAGSLTALSNALMSRTTLHVLAGELTQAASLIEEAQTLTETTRSDLAVYSALPLAAWRGREAEVSELIATTNEVVARGGGIGLSTIHWASAVLYNGLGRYDEACESAERAIEYPHDTFWALSELIEAATRTGKTASAGDALQRLSEMTDASGSDWGLGIQARSRALLSDGKGAERLYREAIDRLGRTHIGIELARANLLYGEWLRRRRRRLQAREQLRTAHEMLTAMGLEAFAQRAARELRATGETARKRTVDTSGQLTAQEAQIARLAREGLSNPEIGTRLFISPRTVEYHLHKVFTKVGVTSRRQLREALADAPLAILGA
jgi:DNA-binding CsgD family transcriptional regulator/tetratricopeptide (TPR) repeat protein